jgi:Immunoglobulin domain
MKTLSKFSCQCDVSADTEIASALTNARRLTFQKGRIWSMDGTNIYLSKNGNVVTIPRSAIEQAVLAHAPELAIPLSIDSQPRPVSAKIGSAVSFFVKAIADNPISFQWQKNSVAINGATSNSYKINSIAQTDAGVYCCVVSAGSETVTSKNAVLTITP